VTDPSLLVGDVLFEPHREQVAMRRRDTMDLIAILEFWLLPVRQAREKFGASYSPSRSGLVITTARADQHRRYPPLRLNVCG
jgi:hypothetical protein